MKKEKIISVSRDNFFLLWQFYKILRNLLFIRCLFIEVPCSWLKLTSFFYISVKGTTYSAKGFSSSMISTTRSKLAFWLWYRRLHVNVFVLSSCWIVCSWLFVQSIFKFSLYKLSHFGSLLLRCYVVLCCSYFRFRIFFSYTFSMWEFFN